MCLSFARLCVVLFVYTFYTAVSDVFTLFGQILPKPVKLNDEENHADPTTLSVSLGGWVKMKVDETTTE